MIKRNFGCLMAGAILIVCFCSGCGKKGKENQVVARINDYVMTAADMEDEIQHSPYAAEAMKDMEKTLDLAIRKQVLIQEAQRQGLDRKKSFMKTIERYWRQTLIKELLEKETQKIYQSVTKEEQVEAMNNWMDGLYGKADIKIYKKALKKMQGGR